MAHTLPLDELLEGVAATAFRGGYSCDDHPVSVVDGCLALLDNDFANEKKGWALVRVMGKNCSSQSIVTRCKYYEQFTTEEALEEAAKSYGGLK